MCTGSFSCAEVTVELNEGFCTASEGFVRAEMVQGGWLVEKMRDSWQERAQMCTTSESLFVPAVKESFIKAYPASNR